MDKKQMGSKMTYKNMHKSQKVTVKSIQKIPAKCHALFNRGEKLEIS